MNTAAKWALRLSLTARAVLLANDSGKRSKPLPNPKKPAE
jgi:hypothetical protein